VWCTRGEGEEAREGEEAPGSAAGAAREEERRQRDVEDGPDRWAPPVSRRVREKRGGPAGLNGSEVEIWAAAGRKKGMGWACWARMRNRVWFYFIFSPFQPFIQEIFQVFQKKIF
jgi:hypothetical protein